LSMSKVAEEELQITREQPAISLSSSTLVLKHKGTVEVRVANPIPKDPNHATIASYQVGIPNIEDRVKLMLLGDIIQDPVFAMLRTKYQLGYVVFGYTSFNGGVAEIRVLVQGFREDPDAVELLMESAVHNITTILSEMPSQAFKERKNNIKLVLEEKSKTLSQEASKAWDPIWHGHSCFNKREKMLAHLAKMDDSTKGIVEMWQGATAPSPTRKKVVVKLFGKSATSEHSLAATSSDLQGHKVIKMIDSSSVEKQMKEEKYWPTNVICEAA